MEHGLQARGLSSCGLWALEHRLSSCGAQAQLLHGMWDLPGPGFEPVSPCISRQILNHCTTREAQQIILNSSYFMQLSQFILDFPWFVSNVFFCPRILIQHTTLHLTIISSKASLGCDSLSELLYFVMTLTVLRSIGQVVCRTSHSLGLSDIFLVVRQGLWIIGTKTTEAKCHSHHVISREHTISVTQHC